MNTEKFIWDYFKNRGFTDCGVAGLMGNLYAESALNPRNLQGYHEKKFNMTDDSYTEAVDNGTYDNFIKDSAGYGLAQWTYWTRKRGLLQFANERQTSIGDLEMQLDYLYKELTEDYSSIVSVLRTATTVLEASNIILFKFERPANQDETVQAKRCSYGQKYYDKYAETQLPDSESIPSSWAKEDIEWAISKNILKGDGKSYQLRRNVTREECLVFIHRLYQCILEELK